MTNYSKSCRICLAEGSRDIFTSMAPPGAGRCDISASSVSRLLEKLRYVTMIQISENDNLPTLICDSCIVELNVAYNFKRQAIDTSIFLQRHTIEMGRSVEETLDVSPPRVFVPPKETPLEVKRELLDPQGDTPSSSVVPMTTAGSPTTSVASGSSRSMVFVNTNSFPNIGADSTSDKDFVESYLPPKKRGREFQSQLLTPTPSPHHIEVSGGKPEENSTALESKSKTRTQILSKQITLRPRAAQPNYFPSTNRPKKSGRTTRNTPTDKNTRHKRFKTTSLNTTPAGQAINPVAMVKTLLRSRRKRLTIS